MQPAISAAPAPMTYSCERKRCTEMTTCQEALHKLNFCNHVGLDSDKDGIPCESICDRSDVDSFAAGADAPEQTATVAIDNWETGPVTRVVDGDTIDVLIDGKNTRIRYLQMNTPERDEACSRESTQANSDLVQGKTVHLRADKEDQDRYGRLLRFVYCGRSAGESRVGRRGAMPKWYCIRRMMRALRNSAAWKRKRHKRVAAAIQLGSSTMVRKRAEELHFLG